MPAWIGTFVGWIIKPLWGMLLSLVQQVIANRAKAKADAEAAKAQAQSDMQKAEAVTPASSAEEVDSAINDASKHL